MVTMDGLYKLAYGLSTARSPDDVTQGVLDNLSLSYLGLLASRDR